MSGSKIEQSGNLQREQPAAKRLRQTVLKSSVEWLFKGDFEFSRQR